MVPVTVLACATEANKPRLTAVANEATVRAYMGVIPSDVKFFYG